MRNRIALHPALARVVGEEGVTTIANLVITSAARATHVTVLQGFWSMRVPSGLFRQKQQKMEQTGKKQPRVWTETLFLARARIHM